MAKAKALPSTTSPEGVERTIIRRHGLAWNYYVGTYGRPALFWPDDAVTHPDNLDSAIDVIESVSEDWFRQALTGGPSAGELGAPLQHN